MSKVDRNSAHLINNPRLRQGRHHKTVPQALDVPPGNPRPQSVMKGSPAQHMITPTQQGHKGSERLEDSPGFNAYLSPKLMLNTQHGKKQPPGRPVLNQPIKQSLSYTQPIESQQIYSNPMRSHYSSSSASRVPEYNNRLDTNSRVYTSSRRRTRPPYLDILGRKTYNPSYRERTMRRPEEADIGKRETERMVKLCAVKRPSERTTGELGCKGKDQDYVVVFLLFTVILISYLFSGHKLI